MNFGQWGPMRQRLLLVAGWVFAAIGTSVVASAAVAATGGQVTDRALRPLTAAEVAALPEGSLGDLSESLASGDSSNEVTPGSGTVETLEPGRRDPAGAEGALGTADDASFLAHGPDGPEPVFSDLPEVTEPDPIAVGDRPTTDSRVLHLDGGSISLASTDDMITLLWATPRLGWSIDIAFPSASQLIVLFSDGTTAWTTNVVVVDGTIETSTQQTGL